MLLTQSNPFLHRLSEETAIVENHYFRVVKDANPLMEEHYLLYTKKQYDSIADVANGAYQDFLTTELSSVFAGGFCILERGKGYSCTGGNIIHAHAHLLPFSMKAAIESSVTSFPLNNIGQGDMCELLDKAKEIKPYIMLLDNSMKGSLLGLNGTLPKSVARILIEEALKCASKV